jgi:hypothetical protein
MEVAKINSGYLFILFVAYLTTPSAARTRIGRIMERLMNNNMEKT